MAVPTRFSRTTPRPERLAPRLGEHGPEILAEAGFSAVEIRELSEAGVLLRTAEV
jgi:crotonobetainyl-CoA:carnitine CoA-transferase CaiB-like acyl-CoA transferase